ncbi:MAG TPA: hypothetical protein VFS39_15860, partial [Nitrospira sp.]|nr:hypothetical protein [Nitrospira sp.]
MCVVLLHEGSASAGTTEALPVGLPDWNSVVSGQASHLTMVDSEAAAKDLFVSELGAALHLSDVAGTIAAKGLPAKLTKDLLLPDVLKSV